uniref:Uncharacterized protein n=1 Tax=Tanacetum cinerariifolium TaxID=118510 RepID=A0A699K4Y0_TANCI|nr:hypothetical protein [Tanacetum cinerariifolium]
MAKSSSENEPCCSKDCKKNNDSLNSKIKDLTGELSEANNYIYHYRLAIDQLEGRLVEYKERKVKYIEKIRTLEMYRESNLKCIKTIDKELETLKEEKDVVKEGVGYNAVPLAAADLYLSPKKDLSWIGLPEFADDTVTDYSRPSPTIESTSEDDQNRNSSASENEEPIDSILSKPAVKFVKAVDRLAERPTTNKLKLKRVQRETTRSQNHAYVSPLHRSAGHRSYGASMRPSHRPAGHRPHGPPIRPMRSNMNYARPKKTSALRPQYRA